MKKMGEKDAINAILANLRSKILKIFRGSMPPDPQDRAKKFLPENQPDHLETLHSSNGLKKPNRNLTV